VGEEEEENTAIRIQFESLHNREERRVGKDVARTRKRDRSRKETHTGAARIVQSELLGCKETVPCIKPERAEL